MEGYNREQLRLASDTWESVLRAYHSVSRSLVDEGSFEDLPMREYDVLYTLAKAGRALTQSELLEAVVLSQPALSRMLGRMEQQGYIARARHCDDGRASLFSLTEQGRQAQRRVGRRHGKAVAQRLYESLDEQELADLCALTTKLSARPRR